MGVVTDDETALVIFGDCLEDIEPYCRFCMGFYEALTPAIVLPVDAVDLACEMTMWLTRRGSHDCRRSWYGTRAIHGRWTERHLYVDFWPGQDYACSTGARVTTQADAQKRKGVILQSGIKALMGEPKDGLAPTIDN